MLHNFIENMKNELMATVMVEKTLPEVWELWTNPHFIKMWNVPFDNWHCPSVLNNLTDGGSFNFRMENANTKEGFNYRGVYDRVIPMKCIESTCEDGRKNTVEFQASGTTTIIRETFEAESETPLEKQQNFTDAVLKKFKTFSEHLPAE